MRVLGIVWLACALAACTPLRPLDPIDGGARPDAAARDAAVDAARIGDAGCDPAAADVCNGIDDDCDPSSADGSEDPQVGEPCDGADADACLEGTYGACAGGTLACSDASPDTPETCVGAGVDEDCDGMVDEAGASDATTLYLDADGDGWGADATAVRTCGVLAMHVPRGGDCDDADRDVQPSRDEQCNAIDDDCDGMIDDGDPCGGDCSTRHHGTHAYQLCDRAVTWSEAEARCSAFGYDLVHVGDAVENEFLFDAAASLGITGIRAGAPSGGIWIGLRYASGTFRWTDGTAPGFTDWGDTEPNDLACGRLRTMTRDWGDLTCTIAYPYICESLE